MNKCNYNLSQLDSNLENYFFAPDYKNCEVINTSPYTCKENGFVKIMTHGRWATGTHTINGIDVTRLQLVPSSNLGADENIGVYETLYPVLKGDVVTTDLNTLFFPIRRVSTN